MFNGFNEATQDVGGIGDVTTGFNYLWCQETACNPSVIATWDVTAPTGNPQNPLFLSDAGLGSGVWATSLRLLMVKTYDPLVIFWGGGYRFTFEDDFGANQVDIGDQILYNAGVGFAVNERVTLSTAFIGSYVTDLEVNGVGLNGTDFDLASIRMAATIARCGRITEPFVEFGLTERSPSASFGVQFTR